MVALRTLRVPIKLHVSHDFVFLGMTGFPVKIVTKTPKVALERKFLIEHFATRNGKVKYKYCVVENKARIDLSFNFCVCILKLFWIVNFDCLESRKPRNLFFDEGWNEENLSELPPKIPTVAIVSTSKHYVGPN